MYVPRHYVECEARALLNEGQYEGLKARLIGEATLLHEDWEETHYYEGAHDLRIQKSGSRAKVWLNKPKNAEGAQQRIDIPVAGHQFDDLVNLFETLGYNVGIVWHRHRMRFAWGDVTASLDYTKGYGHVLELKKSAREFDRERVNGELREKLESLGLRSTPKPVLHDRFTWYRMRWRELLAAEGHGEHMERAHRVAATAPKQTASQPATKEEKTLQPA